MKIIRSTNLSEVRAKQNKEAEKDRRIADLELALAEQVAVNAELTQRQQDTELMLADILAN